MSDAPVKRPRGRPRKRPLDQKQSEQITSVKEPAETKVKVKEAYKVDDDDAGELIEQPKLDAVNQPEPEPEETLDIPSPPPPGWRWVYNRLAEPYEAKFNGKPIPFKAHEFQQISADIAPHICSWSIVQLPKSGPPVRALVLDGKKGYGKPLKSGRPADMVDRSQDEQFKKDKFVYVK